MARRQQPGDARDLNANRTWTDSNAIFVPDCNLAKSSGGKTSAPAAATSVGQSATATSIGQS